MCSTCAGQSADMLRVWVSDWGDGADRRDRSRSDPGSGGPCPPSWTPNGLAWRSARRRAGSVDHIDTREPPSDDGVTITGTVAAIRAIQCCFDARPGEPGTWPVPGSQHVASVAYAAHWVPDEPPRRFVGWLVDLTLHYVIAADPVGPPC